MRSLFHFPGSPPSLVLVLALGCGDSVAENGDDEAGDVASESESADSSNDPVEAGSEANDANDANDANETGSSSENETVGTSDSDSSDAPPDTDTGTETEEPIDCLLLDELTCKGTDVCSPYVGSPYTVSIDGMTCLGPSQFLGCLFAIDACLPATGTLCMGEQAFAVDSQCPPPEGFAPCEPPIANAVPCMP